MDVRVDRPIFDIDYDDSWVASVPEVIGGYRVLYISTPKSRACSQSPVIDLQTPQESLSGFLGDPPDVHALMQALPELPSNVRLSFGPSPIDKEEMAVRDRRWNEAKTRTGCIPWGQVPDLSDWHEVNVRSLNLSRPMVNPATREVLPVAELGDHRQPVGTSVKFL